MECDEIQSRLAANLRNIRKSNRMTQFELAVKCDLSEAMIKNIELKRSWPSERTLSQLTKALDIDVYTLFRPLVDEVDAKPALRDSIKQEITLNLRRYINEQLDFLGSE